MKKRLFLAVTLRVMVLSGGLVLANYGGGVTPALAAPTDQHIGLTQNWDDNLPSASRFTVLAVFGGLAVRDNNTGLVWERAPDGTPREWQRFTAPLGAISYCLTKNVGGTVGWRLPSVVELNSVRDGSPEAVAPYVPASAFTLSTSDSTPGVQSANYWSATTVAGDTTIAWTVIFNFGGGVGSDGKTVARHVWCVRGGMNADQY